MKSELEPTPTIVRSAIREMAPLEPSTISRLPGWARALGLGTVIVEEQARAKKGNDR